MTSAISWALLASGLALLLSIGALFALGFSWGRFRNSSAEILSQRLSAAETLIEKLSSDFKNLRAAKNMAAHRERKNSPESSDHTAAADSADATRRELNRKLASGELKPRGL